MGNTSKRDAGEVANLELEESIIQRRRAGLTWSMIAKELGYANASGPFKVFRKAVERLRQEANETVDEQRWIEVARLEAVLRGGLYQRAQRGELAAIDRMLAIQTRISAYLGLDAPKQQQLTGANGGPLMGDAPTVVEAARLVRELFGEHGARGPAVGEVTVPPAPIDPAWLEQPPPPPPEQQGPPDEASESSGAGAGEVPASAPRE